MSDRRWFAVYTNGEGLVVIDLFPLESGATAYLTPEDAGYLAERIRVAAQEAYTERNPSESRSVPH